MKRSTLGVAPRRRSAGGGEARRGFRAPALLPTKRPARPVVDWTHHLSWYLVAAAVVLGLVYLTWSVVGTLFASAVFAWMLHPLVTALERRGLGREKATLAVLFGVIAALGVGVLVVVPTVVSQVAELSTNIRPYVDKLSAQVGPAAAMVESRFGVHIPLDLGEVAEHAPDYLKKISPDMRERAQAWLQTVAKGGISFVLGVFGALLLPLFVFYVLRDWPLIVGGARELIPVRWRPTVDRLGGEIDVRLQAFVRGQLSVAFVLGCVYSVGLLVAGVDLALMVGFLGGLLFLVPYLGTAVGAGLAGILAVLEFGFDWHVVVAILTFVVGQAAEGTFITPWLVGDRVGLHPLVVMVALIVGGNLLGMWGLILAVPITATLAVLVGWIIERWRASAAFGGGA